MPNQNTANLSQAATQESNQHLKKIVGQVKESNKSKKLGEKVNIKKLESDLEKLPGILETIFNSVKSSQNVKESRGKFFNRKRVDILKENGVNEKLINDARTAFIEKEKLVDSDFKKYGNLDVFNDIRDLFKETSKIFAQNINIDNKDIFKGLEILNLACKVMTIVAKNCKIYSDLDLFGDKKIELDQFNQNYDQNFLQGSLYKILAENHEIGRIIPFDSLTFVKYALPTIGVSTSNMQSNFSKHLKEIQYLNHIIVSVQLLFKSNYITSYCDILERDGNIEINLQNRGKYLKSFTELLHDQKFKYNDNSIKAYSKIKDLGAFPGITTEAHEELEKELKRAIPVLMDVFRDDMFAGETLLEDIDYTNYTLENATKYILAIVKSDMKFNKSGEKFSEILLRLKQNLTNKINKGKSTGPVDEKARLFK